MNVWIVNHYATHPDVPGVTRHFDFAKELTAREHRVTIFASAFVHATRMNQRLGSWRQYKRESIDGVEFCWIRTTPYHGGNDWRRAFNMLTFSLRFCAVAARFAPKPDVILASSPHPFAGLSGYVVSRARHAGFVFEVRDLWPQTLVDIGGYSPGSPVVRLLRVLERFLYRRADRIVVLLPKASEYIVPLGIEQNKVVHIPNGVNPETFRDRTFALPAEIGAVLPHVSGDGRLLIGYAGAHGIANALDTIVEAAALLQQRGEDRVHFLMVGDGPEKPRLVRKIADLRLKNVSFFAPIPKKAIPHLLSILDVATISWQKSPLYRYGMSANKVWDYMMSGTPIVWASDSTYDPVAEAGCGLTVPAEDPAKLAEALVEMCNMTRKEREQMGMRGHEWVMEHQSTPLLAGRLLGVLQEMMNE